MGANSSKFKVLCLPAQSGKTRKMITLIRDEYVIRDIDVFKELVTTIDDPDEQTINFLISSNNKLLVSQNKKRLDGELKSDDEDAVIEGEIFKWVSGSNKTNISMHELACKIQLGEIEMVVCCAHPKRVEYVAKTIEILSKLRFEKKINIWVDEGDKSIDLWSKYEHIISIDCVRMFSPITATPDAIHKRYAGYYHVFSFPDVVPDCYRGFKACRVVKEDLLATSAADYTEKVLALHPEILQPGSRIFTPGNMTKKSHDEMTGMLLSKGIVVAVFNGDFKEIRFPSGKTVDLKPYFKTDCYEMGDVLSRIYRQNNLARNPFAITGYLCIQRGITFQTGPVEGVHDGFLFDYGIIPPISDKSEAYQVMARMFGNIGSFSTYKQGIIFSTSLVLEKAEAMDRVAHNLPKFFTENKPITADDMKMVIHPEEEVKKNVPVVVRVEKKLVDMLLKNKRNRDVRAKIILNALANANADAFAKFGEYTIKQITAPGTDSSYKKHFSDPLSAAEKNEKFKIDINMETESESDIMNVYIDTRENRLLYVFWSGSAKVDELEKKMENLNPFE